MSNNPCTSLPINCLLTAIPLHAVNATDLIDGGIDTGRDTADGDDVGVPSVWGFDRDIGRVEDGDHGREEEQGGAGLGVFLRGGAQSEAEAGSKGNGGGGEVRGSGRGAEAGGGGDKVLSQDFGHAGWAFRNVRYRCGRPAWPCFQSSSLLCSFLAKNTLVYPYLVNFVLNYLFRFF